MCNFRKLPASRLVRRGSLRSDPVQRRGAFKGDLPKPGKWRGPSSRRPFSPLTQQPATLRSTQQVWTSGMGCTGASPGPSRRDRTSPASPASPLLSAGGFLLPTGTLTETPASWVPALLNAQ